ncbi:hypothetical protein [Gilliamella sp. wkB112]|uniref:hypothetical protein n=1 Tax=Gilliamella sp. wkB112 TaxID=3120257 RepID=UPI00080EA83B|nr:hypothetical protein [Gilliamella apicola]OCG01224.1 hypothetical protein A9G12_01320 [Gilliamella apicola]
MKIFKVITLAMMGLFLVNCDNSKSTVSDIKQKVEQTSADINDKAKDLFARTQTASEDAINKIKDGNYKVAQDEVINGIKKQLPVVFDGNTTLVDVTNDNNIISYKYTVVGMTKDSLQNADTQKAMLNNLLALYCGKDATMKALQLVFTDGVSNNYYINDENVLSLNIKPSDCKDNSDK